MKALERKFNRRFQTLVKSSARYNREVPFWLKRELWDKLLDSYNNGFECPYCHKKLKVEDTDKRYPDVFSLDHITPLALGGLNIPENIEFCCNACNIMKGTTDVMVFVKLVGLLMPQEREKWFDTAWRGQIARKLSREGL